MGRKSRNKRMRKLLRPGASPAHDPGRRASARSASGAKAKVKRLLEAMVDAAIEDLASGVEKPRVSYGQALRAGELLVRYEDDDAEDTEVEPAESEDSAGPESETHAFDLTPPASRGSEVAADAATG